MSNGHVKLVISQISPNPSSVLLKAPMLFSCTFSFRLLQISTCDTLDTPFSHHPHLWNEWKLSSQPSSHPHLPLLCPKSNVPPKAWSVTLPCLCTCCSLPCSVWKIFTYPPNHRCAVSCSLELSRTSLLATELTSSLSHCTVTSTCFCTTLACLPLHAVSQYISFLAYTNPS